MRSLKLKQVPLIVFYLSLCLGYTSSNAQSNTKPNIIFIYADDWGWGDLSCHGSDWMQTPNIDKLASEGIDFHQFNVLNPVCSPSRVAAITGRYPARYGINSVFYATRPGPEQPDWLDPNAPTTARFLQAAGYQTAHYGKWHMGEKPDNPSVYDYGYDEAAAYHASNTPGISKHVVADSAVAFINRNKSRPFYLDVWLHESHTAHSPSSEAMDLWNGETDAQRKIYGAVISDGDLKVGKVLQALDDAGISDNTIVVFSTDNGPEGTSDAVGEENKWGSFYSIGETGGYRGRKRSLYEGGIRVPFIVRWPDHTPQGVINNTSVITAVDLLPTFCEAAGVTVPSSALSDGESMLSAFKGATADRTRPVFWLHTGASSPDNWPRLAVRDGKWKLVSNFDGTQLELHNMETGEFEDSADDLSAQYPEIADKLFKMVTDWYAELPTEPDPNCLSTYVEPIEITYNLASTGTVSQSSIANGNGPQKAIDGNFSGAIADGSVIETNEEDEPWWEVDLGSEKIINTIGITNRSDACCISNFSTYAVQVLDNERNAVYTRNGAGNDKAVINVSPNGVMGRFIRIALRQTGVLTIAEVVVSGVSNNLKLQVTDKNSGENIEGASIVLNNAYNSITSEHGISSFQLPQDIYNISITKAGYTSIEQNIEVASDVTLSFPLSPISNLALSGTASQSTTAYNAPASRAIDGTTDGVFNNNSVSHTDVVSSGTWWKVSLDNEAAIDDIKIFNRTDSNMDRLSNFTVEVLNRDGAVVYTQTITSMPNPFITINVGHVVGNQVRITQNLESTALTLAEVEIYGYDATLSIKPEHTKNNSQFSVTPNPTKDIINIKTNTTTPTEYLIYNLSGRVLLSGTFNNGITTIDLSQFNQGLYLIKFSNKGKFETIKILKE
ncbi:sulfatase-like hydrolase/transferase [Tamlana agarivorans]|uniref:Sulfatase-like hydrolase/transferase n=1 Tax=Pseudotamlana agarivorans TaxID=481183 RepID=A0ACC5UBX7_9FLAO|nr:sulfatase-like hydrolase/transferase [Tamlana agarivorans]MBU2951700.1 sulfatase-like hydrolase/transferase [Tamlana agarivorans]